MITCSIGICVYNEAKNIKRLLQSLEKQQLKKVKISEILIIVSGSTDRTLEIVSSFKKTDKRIKVVKQKEREGKASAVNLFLNKARNEVLILMGGDLLLAPHTVESLAEAFEDAFVGMTGARPIPINNISDGLPGYAGHLLWGLHHRISLRTPKMGEVIAFRKVFRRIPLLSSVDEANIEPLIRGQGYSIKYVPDAIIYNKAPVTISDFIKQRRRIYCGHLAVKYEQSYEVATMNGHIIFLAVAEFLVENRKIKYFLYTPIVIALEVISRYLGWWDYTILKKRHTVWETIESTKKLK